MKICPRCHAEFQDFVASCFDCNEPTINESVWLENKNKTSAAVDFADQETVFLTQGTLSSCREVELVLKKGGVLSFLTPIGSEESVNASVVGTTTIKNRYGVTISQTDLPKALFLLEEQFSHLVAKEGQGSLITKSLNLEMQDQHCPACGEELNLLDGHCSSCGLYLGVPNEVAD